METSHPKDLSRYRVKATLKKAWFGKEDHGILTASLQCETKGYAQPFGNLCLEHETLLAFKADLCNTFGVRNFQDLVEKECYLLYSFGDHNEVIEGLESVDTGRRFTITGFRKRYCPKDTKSKLDHTTEHLHRELARLNRRIDETRQELSILHEKFVDWENV